jgi:thiol-disulfide isomerase/thioredoxin
MKKGIILLGLIVAGMSHGATEAVPDVKKDAAAPQKTTGKRMWAKSILWDKAPDFVVEKWLTKQPEMKGKYVMIEFWATWCTACRHMQPRMSELHKKFGKELIVIGVSDETEEAVLSYIKKHSVDYFMALDSKGRMKKKLGVYGIPHVILIEPGGNVVWEGFPLLKGYELTDAKIEKILAVGRAQKKAAAEKATVAK